jgi:sensor histidine kinase regulating citrate/malate metabolism
MNNAVLLANVTGNQEALWSNPAFAEYYLTHLQQGISAQVMFLTPNGQLMASSDPSDENLLGYVFDYEGVSKARAGQVASYIYTSKSSPSEVIDVFVPVINQDQMMVGILRIGLPEIIRNKNIIKIFYYFIYMFLAVFQTKKPMCRKKRFYFNGIALIFFSLIL